LSFVLLPASFAVLLAGAYFFTNAVEWAGHRLRLGEGAVGSLLAAVGTALPESFIPVIALISGGKADDVAVGAIVGAPFMLATIAMALVGVSAFAFRERRPAGVAIQAHRPTLVRDLGFFLVLFTVALALGVGAPRPLRVVVAIGFVVAYAVYVRLTLRGGGGGVQAGASLKPLYLDASRDDPPANAAIALQLLVALGAIVAGSHLFVDELLHVADRVGASALVLALVLAPLATELPEKANSFLWTREGKDTLALGNITGAMVFQSTLPVALGLAATDWTLSGPSFLAAALGVAGGTLALLLLRFRGRFGAPAVLAWVGLYGAFVAYVAVSG
jgi:cation:H+ antiporter